MQFPDGHPILLIIAGPAGSGKTTLCERMVSEVHGVERVVTATTRPRRPGEIDGVHYHFLDERTFDERLARGEFLEWARVHGRHRYGTLRRSVLEKLVAGTHLVTNIDVQGVRNLQAAAQSDPLLRRALLSVFVTPPTLEELRRRLIARGTDDEAEIARRLATAAEELEQIAVFDHVIESGTREEDFSRLLALWRDARRRRSAPTGSA
jgi:guanylate kinase